ncbi:MAG: hypothetical protein Q9218_006836 [Villophora microphyllina]
MSKGSRIREGRKLGPAGVNQPDNAAEHHVDQYSRRVAHEEIWGKGVDIDSIIRECHNPNCPDYQNFTNLLCPRNLNEWHSTDIAVPIDGACRGNGTNKARSAYGVYLTKTSPYNLKGVVAGTLHTNQRAELHACVIALAKKNGYKNAKGTAVTNADLFMEIDKLIDNLNELGIGVSFWHVPRVRNKEADLLANAALDEALVRADGEGS